ncbi:hypothetical protein LzC2_40870 [Planctomycetes bacterium LzC2]|uniref:DUF1549 domain-containing protein n=2 Tax=Alienimonas chondri TaxID=2681879 RepID=A0ABX1VNL9_9PLAN|nr:hypothetical protein [Alienimonas chondri]
MTRRLIDPNRESVDDDTLDHYAHQALLTWGTVADFKYFLPEIFERTARGQLGPLSDFEAVLGNLSKFGGFDDWPEPERAAVRQWLSAQFLAVPEAVKSLPDDWPRRERLNWANALLAGGDPLLGDVTPLLNAADEAYPHFRLLYAIQHSNQTKHKLDGWWDKESENYRRMLDWLYPGGAVC